MQFSNKSPYGYARYVFLLTGAVILMLCTGCSNFDERRRYWDQQLSTALKEATTDQLKAFASSKGHELNCSASESEYAECYIVDSKSKGALWNDRGRLFVMMKMSRNRVVSHTFDTSLVLY